MRESTQESAPAAPTGSRVNHSSESYQAKTSVRSKLSIRPLLGVLSEDESCFLLWPGAVLDAVMVPQL
jgi:hypothetical protein